MGSAPALLPRPRTQSWHPQRGCPRHTARDPGMGLQGPQDTEGPRLALHCLCRLRAFPRASSNSCVRDLTARQWCWEAVEDLGTAPRLSLALSLVPKEGCGVFVHMGLCPASPHAAQGKDTQPTSMHPQGTCCRAQCVPGHPSPKSGGTSTVWTWHRGRSPLWGSQQAE